MSERVPLKVEIDIQQALQALAEVQGTTDDLSETTITVDGDGSEAEGAVEGVSDSLDSLEGSGDGVTDAINDSFDKTADSAKNFEGVTEQLTGTLNTAASAVGTIQGPLGPLAGRLSTASTLINKVSTSIKGATLSTRAFTVALAATGIGAIIVALGALFQAFRTTQRGQDAFRRAIEPLKFLFGTFFGVLQDFSFFLVDKFKDAWNDPIGAIQDLGNAIWENIVFRFESLMKFAPAVGKALKGVFTLDRNLIAEGANDAAAALVDATTGVENTAEATANLFNDIKEGSKDAIEAGREIAELEIELDELRTKQQSTLANLRDEYEQQRLISRDATLSEEEQLRALDEAVKIRKEIAVAEREELELQLAIAKARAEANDTDNEALREIDRLEAEIVQTNSNQNRELGRLVRRRGTLIDQIDASLEKEDEYGQLLEDTFASLDENIDLGAELDLEIPMGSIQYVEKQISSLNEQINEATSDSERRRLAILRNSYKEQLDEYKSTTDVIVEETDRANDAIMGIVESSADAFANSLFLANEYSVQELELKRHNLREQEADLKESLKNQEISQEEYTLRIAELNNKQLEVEQNLNEARENRFQRALGSMVDAAGEAVREILAEFAKLAVIEFFAGVLGIPSPKKTSDSLLGNLLGFARGGSFYTDGPTPIMVGDNPGGVERVDVTPISSPNYEGPKRGESITNVTLQGNLKVGMGELVFELRDQLNQEKNLGGNGSV